MVELQEGSGLKAYVIGFPNRHRNPRLTQQLQLVGFELVETNGAVDAKTLNVEQQVDIPLFEAVVGRYPIATEVGCAMAHLRAWQYAIDNDLDHLAVFEDDAVLLDFNVEDARASTMNLRGPWFVALERRTGDFLLSHLLVKKRLSVRRCLVQPRGTGGYIISREAALLGIGYFLKSRTLEGISDAWPGPATLFKFYQFLPPPFMVDPRVVSTIQVQRSRDFSRIAVLKKVLRILKSSRWGFRQKLGLILLKLLRPLKYLGSVHFWTAWYLIRFGKKDLD